MFTSNSSNIGKRVVLLEEVETLSGKFSVGHEMVIIGETSRGWDLQDKQGNKILEAGLNGHKEYKILQDKNKLFTIHFLKDGVERTHQIPAITEQNALVRLGQIYGDKEDREDVNIEILEIRQ